MILLWLLPPIVVTLVAMLWVSWLGRDGRGEVDRDEAVRRLGHALEAREGGRDRRRPWARRTRPRPGYAVPARPRDRSSGVAVRRAPHDPASPIPPAG